MENGSWAPCAARVMRAELEGMKNVEVVENTLTLRGCLKQSDMPAMQALADAIDYKLSGMAEAYPSV